MGRQEVLIFKVFINTEYIGRTIPLTLKVIYIL